jgi:hypothetical protein
MANIYCVYELSYCELAGPETIKLFYPFNNQMLYNVRHN